MNWSEDQRKVIDERDSSVLVSAAAGSGKTAVMVERIIELISDEDNDVNLDEMLIMTFTRAAAQGMRSKISEALRKKSEENPDNKRLLLQRAMLPRAKISTIHSFCEQLIKQNYQSLEIDPSFRLSDEGEAMMLKKDVLKELIEEKFLQHEDEGTEDYIELAEAVTIRTNNERIETLIDKVYNHLMGEPWPKLKLGELLSECDNEISGNAEDCSWYGELFKYIAESTGRKIEMLNMALDVCLSAQGPIKYEAAIRECVEIAENIRSIKNYGKMWGYLNEVSFLRLPNKSKKDDYDEEKQEFVKKTRNDFKKYIDTLNKSFFAMDTETFMASVKTSGKLDRTLLMLVSEYMDRYAAVKIKKNVLDFNDLEHYAVRLLYDIEDGKPVVSKLADELSRSIKEIMIDEYQDSSRVQEAMLSALSRERFGKYNIFMVGDVKQSIYRFRNAEPDLFINKFNSYKTESGEKQRKIELNFNFRSRKEVLDSVNAVFDKIMTSKLGGIEYDENASLKCGANYPDTLDAKTEVIIIDPEEENEENLRVHGELTENMSKEDLEYEIISEKIMKLIGKGENRAFQVLDKKTGELRDASYGDIAILTRKKKPAVKLAEVLKKNGIPAAAESSEGYFETAEIRMMLNLLSIIDNPMQDIPLAAVLRGPVGDFCDDELAYIRAGYSDYKEDEETPYKTEQGDLYRAVRYYMENGDDEELKNKLSDFIGKIEKYRFMSDIVPVHVLINNIYIDTGCYSYASAMPDGNIRKRNLDKLIEKAESYGSTSYRGLFNFIRYIEELKKYSEDNGENSGFSENDDVVGITTIHKSKGLEYPIVILACSGALMSGSRQEDAIVVDKLGIGIDYIDAANNIKYPGVKKALIRQKQKEADAAEEERLLYVAMTRAMEKLIITGIKKKAVDECESKQRFVNMLAEENAKFPVEYILSQKTYLDWVSIAAVSESSLFDLKIISSEAISNNAVKKAAAKIENFLSLTSESAELFNGSEELDSEIRQIKEIFDSSYRYINETKLSPKISVSDVKRIEADVQDLKIKVMDTVEGAANTREREISAATRGTAYHRAMELIDLKGTPEMQLERVLKDSRFSESDKAILDKEAVLKFLKSGLAERMTKANKKGLLYREKHFMAGFPASDLLKSQGSDETQILQGIIDAYFEEDGELILVDYKTDRLREEKDFLERYEVQLKLYKASLEQLTKKTVRESIIYSTFLNKEIVV